MRRALIVVAKEPQAGQTKTRLTPPLSPDQAAELYRNLMLDTFWLMDHVGDVQPVVAYAPDHAAPYFRSVAPPRFHLVPQRGADLGQRLDHVLSLHLNDGYDQAVVMNSDGPTLPLSYLEQAFAKLDDPAVDVVLGPSEDGGYYLVGIKRPLGTLFNVTMSTPSVLQETLFLADRAGLMVACLEPWYDVDVWDDISRLSRDLARIATDQGTNTRRFLDRLLSAKNNV